VFCLPKPRAGACGRAGCPVLSAALIPRLFPGVGMNPLVWLFEKAIEIYSFLLLVYVILTVLINFGIVNSRQPIVSAVGEFLYRITEPLLAPIRRRLPNLGPIDISPVILLLLLQFLVVTERYFIRQF
jgi:YggT family protein